MPTAPDGAARAPLRERKRAQTRERIVSAGLRLFLTHGFDATTVAHIAEAADVSPATVFRYFGTKEALLFANHDAEEQELRQAIRRHQHLSDTRAVMATAVLELAADMSPDDDEYTARIRVIRSSPVLLGAALRTRADWEAAAAHELASVASRDPDVTDAVAANAAIGALHAGVRLWYAHAGERDLTDCVQEALTALWPDLFPDAGTDDLTRHPELEVESP